LKNADNDLVPVYKIRLVYDTGNSETFWFETFIWSSKGLRYKSLSSARHPIIFSVDSIVYVVQEDVAYVRKDELIQTEVIELYK